MAAEGFEPYHVPQQSRREKLRVLAHNQPESTSLFPLFDPSLIPSDLLTCTPNQQGHMMFHNNNILLSRENQGCSSGEKEEVSNFMMGFSRVVNASSCSSSSYLDSSIQVINNNPFLYNQPQAFQNLSSSEMMVFKPEPLSLSLSSHINNNNTQYPYGCASNEVFSRNIVPLGPFTGYAMILKGSRFLKPAQQLLEEVCGFGVHGIYTEKIAADATLMEPPPMESLSAGGIVGVDDDPMGYGNESRKQKPRLLTMLDEVYKRYKQYYQQMQAVVTSFEYVAGLGNAAPYAGLAINAMSKHFRCLKNAITDQIQFINKTQFQVSNNRKDRGGPYSHRPHGFLEHQQQPVWRPQRGLPERAVSVLRAWLYDHFLHPYPTDTDKLMLAKQTGLSRSQVSNWFINARVRLWKPMVEEIHMLESQQAQKSSQREDLSMNKLIHNHVASDHHSSLVSHENPCTSTRNEFPNTNINHQVGIGGSIGSVGNGISLTLGLHQNHQGIGLSEPFPMNAAQRFGLNLDPEGCVISSFESQNRLFGRDVIEGQLLHDL
ncbi:hypothetical protein Lal_00041877 [Lupinus albus]|uniref:Putative transcription factor Homeodomain-TALE-BEL family n=1 Tax=Lupinus albus TaxID=3870 RepID=A0A6A4QUQ2_LUPAL|nr:putative transcription factor Homeodomain-TALE-BEL family [Lupinus albus]KAF1895596.1 hypothetical protein Lal_00041877 [Lupinus albus]